MRVRVGGFLGAGDYGSWACFLLSAASLPSPRWGPPVLSARLSRGFSVRLWSGPAGDPTAPMAVPAARTLGDEACQAAVRESQEGHAGELPLARVS